MEFSQPSLPLPSLWQEYLCTQKASKALYKQGSTDQPNTITNVLPPPNMCTHAHAHPGHAMCIQLVNEPQGKSIESQCLLLGRLDLTIWQGCLKIVVKLEDIKRQPCSLQCHSPRRKAFKLCAVCGG